MDFDLEFADLDLDLPDFSEFTTGIDTMCAIDDALGEESVFRTNMEADLALLDFALEDVTVKAAVVPETKDVGPGGSDLGRVEAEKVEKVVAPPLAPVKPAQVEVVQAPRKNSVSGHVCPKCKQAVASFSDLVGPHKLVCAGSRAATPPASPPPELDSGSKGAAPPPPPGPSPADIIAKSVAAAKNADVARHLNHAAGSIDIAAEKAAATKAEAKPKWDGGTKKIAPACSTCKKNFDGDKHKLGEKCSQCGSLSHCSSCLKTITLKSLGESTPRLFCVKCIGVLRQRLNQVEAAKKQRVAGRGDGGAPAASGRGRGRSRASSSNGRGRGMTVSQSPGVIVRGAVTLEDKEAKLKRLEEENRAQAEQIEALKKAVLESNGKLPEEVSKLEADLEEKKVAAAKSARLHKQQATELKVEKKGIDMMAHLLATPPSQTERESSMHEAVKEKQASPPPPASIVTPPAPVAALAPPPLAPKAIAPRGAPEPRAVEHPGVVPNDLPPPPATRDRGPSAADFLAKSFQELRSRSSSEVDEMQAPAPPPMEPVRVASPVHSSGRGSGGRGRAASFSGGTPPGSPGGRGGRRISQGGRGRGRGRGE